MSQFDDYLAKLKEMRVDHAGNIDHLSQIVSKGLYGHSIEVVNSDGSLTTMTKTDFKAAITAIKELNRLQERYEKILGLDRTEGDDTQALTITFRDLMC